LYNAIAAAVIHTVAAMLFWYHAVHDAGMQITYISYAKRFIVSILIQLIKHNCFYQSLSGIAVIVFNCKSNAAWTLSRCNKIYKKAATLTSIAGFKVNLPVGKIPGKALIKSSNVVARNSRSALHRQSFLLSY